MKIFIEISLFYSQEKPRRQSSEHPLAQCASGSRARIESETERPALPWHSLA